MSSIATYLSLIVGIVVYQYLLNISALAIALVICGSVSWLMSTLVAMLLNGLIYRLDPSLAIRPGVWWLLITTISWTVMWIVVIGNAQYMVRDHLFFIHILVGALCLAGLQWVVLRAVVYHPLKWTLWGFGISIASFWGLGVLSIIPPFSSIISNPNLFIIALGLVLVMLENSILADIQLDHDNW